MRTWIGLAAMAALAGFSPASAQTVFVVNEIYYDGPGVDRGMFTEILGPPGMSLNFYALVGVDGQDGRDYESVNLDGMVIPADGYLVLAQDTSVPGWDYIVPAINWENGPDEVELRYYEDIRDYDLIDAICYGYSAHGECEGGTHGVDVAAGNSLSRCPNGFDTNDNAEDTMETAPTPGSGNDCPGGGPTWMGLCEAVRLDESGYPIYFGEWVHISSPLLVLSNDDVFGSGHLANAASDGECCVYLWDSVYDPQLDGGESVDVIGTVGFAHGRVQIEGPGISTLVQSGGNPLPSAESITTEELATNGESYENCIISLCDLTIVGGDPWPAAGQDASILVTDPSGGVVTLRIDRHTDIDGSPAPQQPFSMCGLGGQDDATPPYTTGYQILPRGMEDVNCGPPSPVQQRSWGEVKVRFRR